VSVLDSPSEDYAKSIEAKRCLRCNIGSLEGVITGINDSGTSTLFWEYILTIGEEVAFTQHE